MTTYLPGQLYSGREDDEQQVVLTMDGIAFVTNRGTSVSRAEAERVYAPLTLVRDVVGSAAEVAQGGAS